MDYNAFFKRPGLQRDVQKDLSAMPWQRAVPNTRRTIRTHAAGMAREELAGEQHQAGLDLREKMHTDEMALGRERLGMAKRQGGMATGLSVANLGLQTFGGILQIRDANRQVKLFNDMAETYRKSGDIKGATQAFFLMSLAGGR